MEKERLLIVEDDESVRDQLKWALMADYEVRTASTRLSALETVRKWRPRAVTLDLGLPPDPSGAGEGMRCLEQILKTDPFIKVIVVTGNAEKESALRAVSSGAYDYIVKPVDVEELKVIVKRAIHLANLERENRELQRKIEEGMVFEDMLGISEAMQDVFSIIERVATTDAPVLILGESGTGKELVARAIHKRSQRKEGPFIPINCAAIPENLLESELFGYEKGAFTGAYTTKKGKIELAHGGTLFFDELGELPERLQAKLLRFLQDHLVERVGGKGSMEVDVRILAATNKDLKGMVENGLFREDLYYRLSVIEIHIPPLRERKEDILLYGKVFLKRFGGKKRFSQDAERAMIEYDWPGNVRELENRVKRAAIMARGHVITPEDMGLGRGEGKEDLNLGLARERLERELVARAILKNDGNLTLAAQDLGITRPTLYELMKRYNIDRDGCKRILQKRVPQD